MRKESETFLFQTLGRFETVGSNLRYGIQKGFATVRPHPRKVSNYIFKYMFYSSGRYSRISPGWQSSSLQMASRVVKRMALDLPVLRMERLAVVMPILSASSLDFIFRLAKAIRFTTLEAICKELDCQPGDILEYRPDE